MLINPFESYGTGLERERRIRKGLECIRATHRRTRTAAGRPTASQLCASGDAPVPKEQAVGVGALAAASSVVLAPQQAPVWLFNSLAALVPDEVLPRVGDTAQTLRVRLQSSAFLHPIRTMAKGHGRGGRYVELNATTYPQPRRVQWGTPTVPEYTDADGDRVVQCLCYPHYYTKSPLLRMVEVMPPAIKELVKFAAQLARPWLTTPRQRQRRHVTVSQTQESRVTHR